MGGFCSRSSTFVKNSDPQTKKSTLPFLLFRRWQPKFGGVEGIGVDYTWYILSQI